RNEGFVNWGVMCAMFPDLDQRTQYYNHDDKAHQVGNHFESTAGIYEYWNMPTWESVYATTLFHTLPSLISQCLLMGISGTMTNDTIDGMIDVGIEDARAFVDGFDRTAAVKQVEYR